MLETGHSHTQGTTQSSPACRQTVGSASQPTAAATPGPAAHGILGVDRSAPVVCAIFLYCILIAAAQR